MNESHIQLESIRLLDIIASEFSSDPMSVQCFDLRIVERVKEISELARESGLTDAAYRTHRLMCYDSPPNAN